ncbi:MAG: PAS domain S-box protein [Acidobacteria bacterium]|nr:PAS domain S-box protein [Acidobacteriota bacterium]
MRAEAHFRGLLDAAPDAVLVVNHKGEIVLANEHMDEMFGYARGELIGQPVEVLVSERFRIAHVVHRANYREAPHRRPMGSGVDLRSVRKDGAEFPAEISLGPLESEEGMLVIAAIRDITERKRAEATLAFQAKELARSNAELERFAYVASHDLQEPLRMVTSFVQLLARRYQGRLGADADKFIGFASDGAGRMKLLIDDLLTYSRVGRANKAFERVDCESVLARVLQGLQVAIREKGAYVTHDPLPAIWGDRTLLEQLFQNLIANAIQFRGNEPPRVHVTVVGDAKGWLFSVQDNGIGIPRESSERIFEVFQRLHSWAEHPGTGIGLAICKKVAEHHGGRIWVESEPEKGARFLFTIPRGEEL